MSFYPAGPVRHFSVATTHHPLAVLDRGRAHIGLHGPHLRVGVVQIAVPQRSGRQPATLPLIGKALLHALANSRLVVRYLELPVSVRALEPSRLVPDLLTRRAS